MPGNFAAVLKVDFLLQNPPVLRHQEIGKSMG
jgi:hypothetical protein